MRERLLADGHAMLPLTAEEAERAAGKIERLGVEAGGDPPAAFLPERAS